MKYNEVIGQEHAKRAIEIALTGDHSIKFIGNEEAEELKEVCNELKIKAIAIKPCYCGNCGNDKLDCICTTGELKRYFKSKKWNTIFDLTIEVKRPTTNKMIEFIAGKCDPEKLKVVVRRVEIAKKIKLKDIIDDPTAQQLLESAIKQNYLISQQAIFSTVSVAKTIAKLDGKNEVTACAVAEALQYRPKK